MSSFQGFVNSLNHGSTTSNCYSSQVNSQNISCSSVKLPPEILKPSKINSVNDSNLLPITVKQEFSCYPSPPASLNHAEVDLSEPSFASGTGSLSISKKFCCHCLKDAIGYIDRSGRLIMNSCTCTRKEMSSLEASQSDDYLFQRLEEERLLYAKCNSRRTVASLPHSESSSPHSLPITLANPTIPAHQHHLIMSWTSSSNDSSGFSSPMSHSTCAFSDADTLCAKDKAEDHYKSRSSSVSSLPDDEKNFQVPIPPMGSGTESQNFTRTPTHLSDPFGEDLENQNEERMTLRIDYNNLHSTACFGVSESIFYSSAYFRAQVNEAKLPPNDERVKLVIQVIGSTVQAHMETCVYTSEKVSLGFQKYKELMSDKPEVCFLIFVIYFFQNLYLILY